MNFPYKKKKIYRYKLALALRKYCTKAQIDGTAERNHLYMYKNFETKGTGLFWYLMCFTLCGVNDILPCI